VYRTPGMLSSWLFVMLVLLHDRSLKQKMCAAEPFSLAMNQIPVYEISTPEYHFKEGKPDFALIGSEIIQCLRKYFLGKRIALRLLSSTGHPEKSLEELIEIIKKYGHDRYDSSRVGDRYENIDNQDIDFFALDFEVGKEQEEQCIQWALDSFYEWPMKNKAWPVRIDIGIVYDPSQLKTIEHIYTGRENEIKRDGFVFKNADKKPNAILGIIKII